MRILLQKVSKASISVDSTVIGSISQGYVLFVGVMEGDTDEQAAWLTQKIVNLRLFEGENGKINDRSILDVGGGVLIISQFTLSADIKNGNRPDYTAAAKPEQARVLYETCIKLLKEAGIASVETGQFGAHMQVELVNDGPVTLLLER